MSEYNTFGNTYEKYFSADSFYAPTKLPDTSAFTIPNWMEANEDKFVT